LASDTARRRGAAIGLAALLLVIGAAGGVAFDRLVLGARPSGADDGRRRRGPPDADQILERYRERIGIDDAQARAIRPVLVKRIAETSAVLERVDPELDAIRRAGDDEVRALLRPDQRPKLDQIRADFEKRRADMRKRLRGEPQERPAPPP
jgi:hypothetical protein